MSRELPIHDRRDDVQGLRAVAVALVVAYHLWPSAVPGGFVGVDVFFVISGFLITRNLLAQPPRGRRDVLSFWERRIRRLLPAAFLVLAVTLLATRIFAPSTDWVRTAREAVASAFYVENWRLVQQATDYLAPTDMPTAVQHYWSLSIEEQFYLVWPILLIATAMLASRRGVQARHLARVVVGVVLVLSLWHSITMTAADPASAYFFTTTRIWELAAGGLVATWIPPERFPPARAVVTWIGLAAIVVAAFVYSAQTPWPGYQALLPILGAVLFIAGASGARFGPGIVLGWPWMQRMGDMSYSIYLWHWPLIILAPFALRRSLTWGDRLGVLVLTGLLAWLTFEFFENRWRIANRRGPRLRPFLVAFAGALSVTAIAGVQVLGVHLSDRAVASSSSDPCFGAAAMARGASECPVDAAADVVPTPTAAEDDQPESFSRDCMIRPPYDKVLTCEFGSGPTKVALVGNSHAAHWLPALEEIADQQGLTITTYLITACTTIDAPLVWNRDGLAQSCQRWSDRVVAATSGDRYDLVITSQRSVYPVEGYTEATTFPAWVDGMSSVLRTWTHAGTNVLVIRDTPLPGKSVPQCVAIHADDQTACSGARDRWVLDDPLAVAARQTGVEVADLNDDLCTRDRCFGVVGGVLAYFDHSHFTATFSRTLAPYLEPEVEAALGRQGGKP